MSNRLDATVGDNRHAELSGIGGHLIDGRGLGTAAGHHLLGDANGARAHAHAQAIDAGLDEIFGLSTGNHCKLKKKGRWHYYWLLSFKSRTHN